MAAINVEISRKVEAVLEAFPVERVLAAQNRLTSVWGREARGVGAFVFVGGIDAGRSEVEQICMDEAGYPSDETLAYQLDCILGRKDLADDYVPSLFPGLRQGEIPCAFGCREVYHEPHYWVEPIIGSASEIFDLSPADFSTSSPAQRILETMRFMHEAAGGRLPVKQADLQGPLSVASQIWGYSDFLEGLLTHPEAAHHLLRLATDAVIEFVDLMEEAAAGDMIRCHCMPPLWLPPNIGITVSDDLLAVLSPAQYAEFGTPYLAEISERFGGLVLHTCGNCRHNLSAVVGLDGFAGLNFGATETRMADVAEAFGTRFVAAPHRAEILGPEGSPRTEAEFVDQAVDVFGASGTPAVLQLAAQRYLDSEETRRLCTLVRERMR